MKQYSLLAYNDLGSQNHCDLAANGQYMSITLNITQLPIKYPLSLCLPKACNDSKLIQNFLKRLEKAINKDILKPLKQMEDFNQLYKILPEYLISPKDVDISNSSRLTLSQIGNLFFNGT